MSILNEIKQQFRMGGITEKIIYLNVILFAVPWILKGILSLFGIAFTFTEYISLSSNPADLLWKPWSVLTYAFFHADFFHIHIPLFGATVNQCIGGFHVGKLIVQIIDY